MKFFIPKYTLIWQGSASSEKANDNSQLFTLHTFIKGKNN